MPPARCEMRVQRSQGKAGGLLNGTLSKGTLGEVNPFVRQL